MYGMTQDRECSVYIHWPFCRSRCSYCPFIAFAACSHDMERYAKALNAEITLFAHNAPELKLVTLYLGGGTPSTWPDELLLDTSARIRSVFCTELLTEVTLEANPGSVRCEQIALWRNVGVNRLSIGVQYCDEAILAALGRHQTMADVYKLLAMASREFDNISVDLMLGLPGVGRHAWQQFIAEVVTWPVTHVSVYCLTVYEHTQLFRDVQHERVVIPDQDEVAAMYCQSAEFLEKHGFRHYEVSNFARPGYESRHNRVYWERRAYKGFGVGACSFDGKRRLKNEEDLVRYITAVERGCDPVCFSELLTDDNVYLETVMLGLRRDSGIRYAELIHNKTPGQREIIDKKLKDFAEAGLVRRDGDHLMLTRAGFAVEQRIIAELV